MNIQTESNLRNGQGRTPLFFKNIQTYASITIDVWMKDLSPKCNLKHKNKQISHLKPVYRRY